MRHVRFPDGEEVPTIGQGTWAMGDDDRLRAEEIATLRHGLDLGLRLVDTAEMYGDGASERLVGEAIAGRRDAVFLVTKVLPSNASRRGVAAACERSLKRLGTDRIDLLLLHWRGSVPLAETIAGFEDLVAAGKIRRWGVSNFDPADTADLAATPGGRAYATNQVLYNPTRRGVEWDLLPQARRAGMPIMAYSPLEQARLLADPVFTAIAAEAGLPPAVVALRWAIEGGGIVAVPKASRRSRVEENARALDVPLTAEIRAAIDRALPPPSGPTPLEAI